MSTIVRLRVVATVLLLVVFGVGCNPLTGMYFLLFGIDDKVPPEFKIAGDGKKTMHVMILTSTQNEAKADLLGIERQLATAICRQLEADCLANKEKIKIVPVHKVEEFKAENPYWRTMDLTDIGRQFDVDYVVDIEVKDMGLYERDSRRRLFRGRSGLTLQVVDTKKSADEGPVHKKPLIVEYPKARGPIPVDDDMSVERFRELFVQRMARDICWQLTAHVSTAAYMED